MSGANGLMEMRATCRTASVRGNAATTIPSSDLLHARVLRLPVRRGRHGGEAEPSGVTSQDADLGGDRIRAEAAAGSDAHFCTVDSQLTTTVNGMVALCC